MGQGDCITDDRPTGTDRNPPKYGFAYLSCRSYGD